MEVPEVRPPHVQFLAFAHLPLPQGPTGQSCHRQAGGFIRLLYDIVTSPKTIRLVPCRNDSMDGRVVFPSPWAS